MKSSFGVLLLVAFVALLTSQTAHAIRVGLCKRLTRRQRQLAARDDFPGATCSTSQINRDIRAWCNQGQCGPVGRAACKRLIRAELIANTFPANCDIPTASPAPTCVPEFCTSATCRSSVDPSLPFPSNCPESCDTVGSCAQTVCSPEIPECSSSEVLNQSTCQCDLMEGRCRRDGQCSDINACRPGVCTDEGECENFTRDNCCVNDQNGRLVDSQCTSTAPVCGAANNRLVSLGSRGTTCYFCEDDRSGNGVDNGCTAASPFCASVTGGNVGTDGLGDACFFCESTSAVTDTNCPSDKPLCGLATGEPAAVNDYGTTCFTCINDGDGVDTGCSPAAPACDAAEGKLGASCTVCKNTDAGTGVDFGCSAARPFCSTSEATDIALNAQGTECFACLDVTLIGATSTLGCTAAKPNCAGGDKCVFCLSSGGPPDFGCGGTNAICGLADGTPLVDAGDEGNACFFCENTSQDVDPGCGAAGVCVADEGMLGASCAVCQNDRGSPGANDLGCPGADNECGFANGTTLAINGFGDECS